MIVNGARPADLMVTRAMRRRRLRRAAQGYAILALVCAACVVLTVTLLGLAGG
jgi:hypothetical protein